MPTVLHHEGECVLRHELVVLECLQVRRPVCDAAEIKRSVVFCASPAFVVVHIGDPGGAVIDEHVRLRGLVVLRLGVAGRVLDNHFNLSVGKVAPCICAEAGLRPGLFANEFTGRAFDAVPVCKTKRTAVACHADNDLIGLDTSFRNEDEGAFGFGHVDMGDETVTSPATFNGIPSTIIPLPVEVILDCRQQRLNVRWVEVKRTEDSGLRVLKCHKHNVMDNFRDRGNGESRKIPLACGGGN